MYEFNWEGKNLAYKLAQTPSTGTLIPDKESSKNWDDTENLYIEGDNLEVLKLLQKSYFGKVKMIYIDPPYNTGKDFVYHDNFRDNIANYKEITNQTTKSNSETNGRYHTDWLNMMYPRLKLARNLLREDGAIFISIDDNEVNNLKKLCDEVYGEYNNVSTVIWKRKRGRDNSAKFFSKSHEYLLVYAKNKDRFDINFLELDEETKKAYKNPDNDKRGPYRMLGTWARGTQSGVEYDFTNKEGKYFKKRQWLFNKENLIEMDKENKIIIKGNNIYRKLFIYENKGKIPETIWDNVSNAANASDEIKSLFKSIIFDTAKPTPYIKEMLKISTNNNDIILDFFSGSSTTAHAIIQMNMENKEKRKFIMVQLPELTDEKSEAYKAGYKNICEIGKERIRRAGDKIVSENKDKEGIENLDIGFKVFKLDYNKGDNKIYNEKLVNPIEIKILTNKKPKELKGKKKIATINKDADYKVQVFVDNDYNLYYLDNHAFASCESEIVDNKVETTWNSCKCWFKIIGLYERRNNHIVDILRDLDSYSEHLYPKNNVADNIALGRLYEQMINIYLDYINN